MTSDWNLGRRAVIEGIEIAYDVFGDGPPAVLVHGFPSNSFIWRDVVPTLTDSEQLLERSIETGQIAISEFLVARREIVSGRGEHLQRQLQLTKAAAAARYVAGVAP